MCFWPPFCRLRGEAEVDPANMSWFRGKDPEGLYVEGEEYHPEFHEVNVLCVQLKLKF